MCNNPQKGVIVLAKTRTTDQTGTSSGWFAQAATAVRQVIDETPGGAFVIHRRDLPGLIADEDHRIEGFTEGRMRGLPAALRARAGLRTTLYREDCQDVLVIFDPNRISVSRAKETVPHKVYAPHVRAALA